MTAIPVRIKERFVKNLSKYQRILREKSKGDFNEADTVKILIDILENVFGYDKFNEISSQFKTQHQYCDLALIIGGKLKVLIEVKSIKAKLTTTHINQICNYAILQGKTVKWLILTNGIKWKVINIVYGKQLSHEELFEFDFLELSMKKNADISTLYLLSKEAVNKNSIDSYYNVNQTLNEFVVGHILISDPVLDVVRRTIKKMNPEIKCDNKALSSIIESNVIQSQIFEDEKGRKAKSQVNKYFKSIENAKNKVVE